MPSNLTRGCLIIGAVLWTICGLVAMIDGAQIMIPIGISIFTALLLVGIAHDLYAVQEYFEFPETEKSSIEIKEVGKMDVYNGHVCPMQEKCVLTYRQPDLCPEEWRCNKL